MKTVKITIANKCKKGESEKSYHYSTRTARSNLFFIPKKGVVKKYEGGIPYNEIHTEEAVVFVLQKWAFDLIREDLEVMRDFDVIMPKSY